MATVKTNGKAPRPDEELLDIDKILALDDTMVNREAEVERVLKCFKLNPYEILELDMNPGVTSYDEVRKAYRKKSLLIHPDKVKHERGIEAFDLLKKASGELEDEKKRAALDQHIADARMLICRSLKIPDDAPDSHPSLQSLNPPLKEKLQIKTKEILIEEELRKRRATKMQMIAEGAEAKRLEDEGVERKRKADEREAWESSREGRVTDWRNFQSGGSKKKKKSNYLG